MSNLLERATRPLLALIVLFAVSMLGLRYSAVDGARGIAQPAGAAVAAVGPGSEWNVAVDGWHIEVDGAVVPPPAAAPLPGVARDTAELWLDRLAVYADPIGWHSEKEGLDWRLVAAVIAEESSFRPKAMSSAGAFGLMQIKEIAAEEVGVFPYDEPESNIMAGVRYLALMRSTFPAPRLRDQHAMMLAAYNMGPGHLRDAQGLARDLGLPEKEWDGSLALVVRVLDQPSVYNRLRHGFAKGPSVVRYVERVLQRYAAYRRRFPALTPPSAAMIADIASR